MKEEKILKILELVNLEDEEKLRTGMHNIMYPAPFYHRIKKCKNKGWEEPNYDDYGNPHWKTIDKYIQYYYCEKWECRVKWTEEEIKRIKDINKRPGCIGPSEICNLDNLSNILDIHFKKYRKEYKLAIGLIYYNRLEEDDLIQISIKNLNFLLENNEYNNIFEWWIFNVNHELNILAHLIVAEILEKEFDPNNELGYKLNGEGKNEERI